MKWKESSDGISTMVCYTALFFFPKNFSLVVLFLRQNYVVLALFEWFFVMLQAANSTQAQISANQRVIAV
jgi:hypothetical protein